LEFLFILEVLSLIFLFILELLALEFLFTHEPMSPKVTPTGHPKLPYSYGTPLGYCIEFLTFEFMTTFEILPMDSLTALESLADGFLTILKF
jgi:hypothetical protein